MNDSPEPHDHPEPDEATQELLRELTEKLTDSTRKIGLYLEHVGVVARGDPQHSSMTFHEKDFRTHVEDGDLLMVGMFTVGDVAWEKRTLDPEQDEIDEKARGLLPSEADELRDRIQRRLAEGLDPFADEDE
jgi:hypothetical protein